MSSRMEQIIEEIEEYIDNCKYQPLSSTKIVVNKDELEELLTELKMKNARRNQALSEDYQQQRSYSGRCPGKSRCHHCSGTGTDQRACQ